MDRIEIIYKALDEMAHEILKNRIPMTVHTTNPNRPDEECGWPETFLAWKQKVIEAEQSFGREPLTNLQWFTIESYMINQYGFSGINKEN